MVKIFTKELVSVVTPVYNGESYLVNYLESIIAQTYPCIELILVDDGSTDQTLALAKSYQERMKKRGIRYKIVQAPHKNASSALGYGLPLINGEYLCWPDSDDVLKNDSIAERVLFLKENPQYKCVRSLAWYFDPKTGNRLPADEQQGDLRKQNLFWDVLESRTYVCCGCYMLKSEDFFAIYPKGKIPVYNVGQNFQMLLPFLYHHQCPTLEKELYGVAVRKGSHSRQPLTDEQTIKKYREYEYLVDDIAKICGITDRISLQRIRRWKLRRRFHLAIKNRNISIALNTLSALVCLGDWQTMSFSIKLLLKWLGNKVREKEWSWYKYRKKKKIKGNPTIIASNCVGTMIYYDMDLPWLSPTVNLMIPMNDFIKFVKKLSWYMKQELHFCDDPNYDYPIGILEDVKIHFIHYQNKEEAAEKWKSRKKRMDWNNLYIIGCEKNGCTYKTLQEFENLPYNNKVILTRKKYPEFSSAVLIKGFETCKELGTIISFRDQFLKRRYMDDFDYVSFLNKK